MVSPESKSRISQAQGFQIEAILKNYVDQVWVKEFQTDIPTNALHKQIYYTSNQMDSIIITNNTIIVTQTLTYSKKIPI